MGEWKKVSGKEKKEMENGGKVEKEGKKNEIIFVRLTVGSLNFLNNGQCTLCRRLDIPLI